MEDNLVLNLDRAANDFGHRRVIPHVGVVFQLVEQRRVALDPDRDMVLMKHLLEGLLVVRVCVRVVAVVQDHLRHRVLVVVAHRHVTI